MKREVGERYIERLLTRGGPNHAWMPMRALAKRWEEYVQAGLLSREIKEFGVSTRLTDVEGNIADGATRESSGYPARTESQGMCGMLRENPEIPRSPAPLIMAWTAQGTLRR